MCLQGATSFLFRIRWKQIVGAKLISHFYPFLTMLCLLLVKLSCLKLSTKSSFQSI